MSPTATEPEAIDASHEFPPEEEDQRPSLFQGWDGLSVLALGVGLPSLLITVCGVVCFERILRMVFKHPVETLAEIGFVALIPIANYIAWKAIRYSDGRHPFRIGLLNGSAIATSFCPLPSFLPAWLSTIQSGMHCWASWHSLPDAYPYI
jgi:hypothetical protein